MKLRMLINLGKNDARELGIEAFPENSVIDVPQTTGDTLIKRGWATTALSAGADSVAGTGKDIRTGDTKAADLTKPPTK